MLDPIIQSTGLNVTLGYIAISGEYEGKQVVYIFNCCTRLHHVLSSNVEPDWLSEMHIFIKSRYSSKFAEMKFL